MNDSAHLDPAVFPRLHRLGGAAFVCKMIDLFLDYAGKKIVEARAAQLANNLTGVENAVHPLKSSAGNVGAQRVQQLATQIEGLARQGQSEPLSALLTDLEAAFAAVKPELEEKRRSFSPEA